MLSLKEGKPIFMKFFKKLTVIFYFCLLSFSVFASQDKQKIDPQAIEKFSTTLGQIKQLYVKDTDDQKLFADAIRGMLAGLDPHSMYLDEEDFKALKNYSNGEFIGIGIEITKEKGLIRVVSPIDDTPAYKAGIKAGDYILAVDDKPLLDVSSEQAVKLMRGKTGTAVKLTVINQVEKKPRIITITREAIKIQSVKTKLYPHKFAYIRISHFQQQTPDDLVKAIKQLEKQAGGKLNGAVLDLRNNPGGLMDPSVDVADAFLDADKLKKYDQKIVYTKGRAQEAEVEAIAAKGDFLNDAPLIVLINEGSASGSEIVAGALQDYRRAIIVGHPSFGKGSVQSVLPLDEKTGIKLTTSLYYTPSGKSIQTVGIKPDILVDELKIQNTTEESLFLWPLREQDLSGFLKNGSSQKYENQIEVSSTDLAKHDFQLYQALQILNSMHINSAHKNP
jgi:carboxyl-terminal processing protease